MKDKDSNKTKTRRTDKEIDNVVAIASKTRGTEQTPTDHVSKTTTCQVVTVSDKEILGGVVQIVGKGYYISMEEYTNMMETLARVTERAAKLILDEEVLVDRIERYMIVMGEAEEALKKRRKKGK